MKKKIVKYRGHTTKKEIIADLIFILFSFSLTIILIFIFDVHRSLYPGETLFPPSKFVGIDKSIYLSGGLIGTITGFVLIKLLLLGIKEELN